MTDSKKAEELNEAELDQVTGAGDTVRTYNLETSWPTKAVDDKTVKGFTKTGGGNSI